MSFGYQVLGFGSGVSAAGPYDTEWLIVAGGAAGARFGGGGGAGGYRNGTTLSLTVGNQYTVTVGGGGAGITSGNFGNDGSDSVISGTGITTTTSDGGGGGAGNNNNGRDGGSGGGSAYDAGRTSGDTVAITQYTAAGEARSIQGYDAIDSVGAGSPEYGAPGGGGAGSSGSAPTNEVGGDGGVGLANDIVEASTNVYYAGGGGGKADATTSDSGNQSEEDHGRTKGGAGYGNFNNNTSGYADATANTGGGGGGCGSATTSGSGGSGIVILRMLSANYSGTVSGSPTESTDGDYKVLKFTGDGSYTA